MSFHWLSPEQLPNLTLGEGPKIGCETLIVVVFKMADDNFSTGSFDLDSSRIFWILYQFLITQHRKMIILKFWQRINQCGKHKWDRLRSYYEAVRLIEDIILSHFQEKSDFHFWTHYLKILGKFWEKFWRKYTNILNEFRENCEGNVGGAEHSRKMDCILKYHRANCLKNTQNFFIIFAKLLHGFSKIFFTVFPKLFHNFPKIFIHFFQNFSQVFSFCTSFSLTFLSFPIILHMFLRFFRILLVHFFLKFEICTIR